MMRIEQIWEELEKDTSVSHGLILRRYSGTVLPDVFIAVQNPEKIRCIAASVSIKFNFNLSPLSNLKDISIEFRQDENRLDRKIILFRLINKEHSDIFSVLCEDLISNISPITDEKELVKELFNRFEKWKSLFDKVTSQGLSAEEQIGLFGELFFLRKFLQERFVAIDIINSWKGPERQIRDFQHGNWAVEVKTTHGNNHQKIHIASERQLDTSNLSTLILYHISLEVRQQAGESLNQIIDTINGMLSEDVNTLTRFRTKLLEGGYFEQHRSIYNNTGYFLRQDTYYLIEDKFPRIEEKDIRKGIGDVKYSIITSQCSEYIKSEKEVFSYLVF